jgi:hypothetical protein
MKKKTRLVVQVIIITALLGLGPAVQAKGRFELSLHYGTWSVNMLRSMIEGLVSDMVENQFKDSVLEDIQEEHPEYRETGYSQTVGFDSGGHNLGFEVRWYPGGQDGSFSLGLTVEKTKMRFTLEEIKAILDLEDTTTLEPARADTDINAEMVTNPLAFLLDFRWDIMPSWRIRPFISFGFGLSTPAAINDLQLSYSYRAVVTTPHDPTEIYEDSTVKTGKELKEEMEAEGEEFPLSFLPFLYLGFGLKGVITDNIHLMVEGAVLDGFVLRGGLALRF